MGQRLRRHLSLFLVVTIATGSFVLPVRFDSSTTGMGLKLNSASAETDTTGETVTDLLPGANASGDALLPGSNSGTQNAEFDAAIAGTSPIFSNTQTLSQQRTFTNVGFFDYPKNGISYLIHVYTIATGSNGGKTTQYQVYVPVDNSAFGGCGGDLTPGLRYYAGDSTKDTTACDSNNPSTYNIFLTDNSKNFNGSISTPNKLQTYQLMGSNGQVSSNLNILLRKDNTVFGLFRPTALTGAVIPPAKMWQPQFTNETDNLFKQYLHWLDCRMGNEIIRQSKYPTSTCQRNYSVSDVSSATTSTNTVGTLDQNIQTLFANVNNSGTTSLADATGDIDLIDNDDAQKPPRLKVSKVKTGLSDDLYFELVNSSRVSTTFWGKNNNYFFFTPNLDKNGAEVKKALNDRGIDIMRVFLVIDAGGNLGVIVNNLKNAGDVLSAGQNIDTIDKWKVIGRFDGNATKPVSTNLLNGGPFAVNLEQYKKVVTRRVYNEPVISQGSTGGQLLVGNNPSCGASVTYPNLNTGYDSNDYQTTMLTSLPIGDYRKCIHPYIASENPQGWLTVWGIHDTKLDQGATDDCTQSLPQNKSIITSAITNSIGSAFCTVLNWMVSGAASIASLTFDFLIKSVGVQ